MPADIRVGLRLTADAKGLVGEVRASRKQIEQLTRAMGWGEAPTRGYARATAEVEWSTRHTGRSLLAAHGALLRYAAGSIPAWAGEPLSPTRYASRVYSDVRRPRSSVQGSSRPGYSCTWARQPAATVSCASTSNGTPRKVAGRS